MQGLIGRLKGFGIHTLVSSHILHDLETTCDWIVLIEGGRIDRNNSLHATTEGETVQVEVLQNPERVVQNSRPGAYQCKRTGSV